VATILLGIVLKDPKNWFLYGAVTTLGSALGGTFAAYLGKLFRKKILEEKGFYWLRRVVGINPANIKEIEQQYQKYGTWAILLGALTPLPYKLFTWVSGILNYDLKKFFVVSLISRGILFMGEAYVIAVFGEEVFYKYFGTFENLQWVIFAIVAILIVYWIAKHSKDFSS